MQGRGFAGPLRSARPARRNPSRFFRDRGRDAWIERRPGPGRCVPARTATPARFSTAAPSPLHIDGLPVLDANDAVLCTVPTPYAVVLPGTEVVLFRPLERPAAQPLQVDLEAVHGGEHLLRRGGPG